MINLSTIIKSHTKISLKWTTTDTGITSFQVYRNGTLISTLTNPTATSYDDTGLSPSTSYTHRVDSLNSSGTVISQSNTITTTTYLWATTFDCPDWVQPKGSDPTGCSDYDSTHVKFAVGNRDYLCNGVTPSLINASGNNPNGGGGKGFRVAIGDGTNMLGASPKVEFKTPQPEIWMRWYIRFPLGFAWNPMHYLKLAYLSTTGHTSCGVMGLQVDKIYYYDIYCGTGYGGNTPVPNHGWNWIMGGDIGDGLWHCYEMHLKMNTPAGTNNGIIESWVDGIKVLDGSNVNFCGGTFTSIALNVNQDSPNNGGCTYVDYDDIAISNTGYIGPITSTPCPQVVCNMQITVI